MLEKALAAVVAQGRLDHGPPVAVIDIGSNSVRLVVYEGVTRSPTPLFNEKTLAGLGREVQTKGLLPSDAMEKALGAGADALILDLEDAVAAAAKPEARAAVAAFLAANRTARLWVRVNPLDSAEHDKDLAAILPGRPDGIVLPKAEGGESVAELARRLTERGNATAQILAIATETPAAIFGLGSYGGARRLAGLTWGAAAVLATRTVDGKACSCSTASAWRVGVPRVQLRSPLSIFRTAFRSAGK